MNSLLQGRCAIVTGAGSGLGRAISTALALQGVTIIAMGRRPSPLRQIVDEIKDLGGHAVGITCDVTDVSSIEAAYTAIGDEQVSILINNAGVAGPVARLVDIQPKEWDEVFASNVRGPYLMCRAVLPGMLARERGAIINIASVAAKRPLAGRTPYGASKAALLGLTRTLAAEVAQAGVSVNSLSPGPVAGLRMDRNFRLEGERRGISAADAQAEYVSRAATRRMVTEDEVGAAVVAMLLMTGLYGADIDLTAGMFA